MDLTLREEDRRAVDLILDRAAMAGGNGNGGNGGSTSFAIADPSMGERVARVNKLVHLLDAMPQFDPPVDLVERTLRFVESTSELPAELHVPDMLAAQRPVV